MTIEEVCFLEPAVAGLLDEARNLPPDEWHCGNHTFYARFKPQIVRLAGWDAMHPALRTEQAYDLVYKCVYDLMPGCIGPARNGWMRCGCLAVA